MRLLLALPTSPTRMTHPMTNENIESRVNRQWEA